MTLATILDFADAYLIESLEATEVASILAWASSSDSIESLGMAVDPILVDTAVALLAPLANFSVEESVELRDSFELAFRRLAKLKKSLR